MLFYSFDKLFKSISRKASAAYSLNYFHKLVPFLSSCSYNVIIQYAALFVNSKKLLCSDVFLLYEGGENKVEKRAFFWLLPLDKSMVYCYNFLVIFMSERRKKEKRNEKDRKRSALFGDGGEKSP